MYNGNNFKQFTHMAILSYGQVGWRSAVAAPVSGIDADAQAFITAASITDSTQQSAINTLVTQLKTYGIWTKLKAVYPFVGGTASSHKFNLKDPRDLDAAFRLVFNGGWTHTSTGAKPNGTTGWATTYFNPVTQLTTLSSNHLATYLRTNIDESTVDMGSFSDPGLGYDIESRYSNVLYSFNGIQNVYLSFANTDSRGLFINTRTGNNVHKILINGVVRGTNANNFLGLPNTNIALATRYNVTTGLPQTYSSKEQAFASIGDGLTDTEAANFYTAVQTFQSTLGRQVGVPIVADTDAQAFLNAAEITDQTQATAINTLVTDLKSANIWTKMKAIYPFVGGTATTHKYNLKDPRDLDAAYRLVFNGGWTHSATGALPNGTTGYANTSFNPVTISQSLSSTHLSVYTTSTNTSGTSRGYIGSMQTDAINYTALGWFYGGTMEIGVIGDGSAGYTGATSAFAGFKLTSTDGSRSNRYFKNGVKTGSNVTQTGGFFNANMYLGAINYIGSPAYYQNVPFTFSSIGDGLSDAEAAAFYTAVQKYQTTLSRNV